MSCETVIVKKTATLRATVGLKKRVIFLSFEIGAKVPRLAEVANFGAFYFLLKIKFLAKRKRELTTKLALK